jgi:hypothetical protein
VPNTERLVDSVRRAELGDAVARFEFKVDDSYVRTSWKRQREGSSWVSTWFAIRILGIGVVWGFATLSFSRQKWTMGALLLLAGVFFALSTQIDEWRIARRARKGPFFAAPFTSPSQTKATPQRPASAKQSSPGSPSREPFLSRTGTCSRWVPTRRFGCPTARYRAALPKE